MPNKAQSHDAEYERLLAQERFILEVTERICAYMDKHNITRTELARRLGKSKGFVSQLLDGGRNLTLRTLADVSYALDSKLTLAVEPVGAKERAIDNVIWREDRSIWESGSLSCKCIESEEKTAVSRYSDEEMSVAK